MVKAWRDYVEPGDELDANSPMKRSSRNLENEEDFDLPLPENILSRNLGLNVIVVVTKVCLCHVMFLFFVFLKLSLL